MCKSNEKSFLISVADIQKVRITCNHCGTAVIMPITLPILNVSSSCVNCGRDLPAQAIKELMLELKTLKNALSDDKVTFELHIEGE